MRSGLVPLVLVLLAGASCIPALAAQAPDAPAAPAREPGTGEVAPRKEQPAAKPAASSESTSAAAPQATSAPSTGSEIRTVPSRWRTFDLQGHPEYTFKIYDPYHQNVLKADFPITRDGDWFLEVSAFNNVVFKSRRNLDFSPVFADQITAGSLTFVRHNNFFNENLIYGFEIRRFDDTFMPSDFRFRINGVADYRRDLNAFNSGSRGEGHLFDAFVDVKLYDFGGDHDGRSNFDLLFLRGGIQGFKSDFHGLVFNDVGLGGRLFGELKKNRLRYDFTWLKLFAKDPATGFIVFSVPSSHNVAIARVTWEDFLAPGWNSEWTWHYNRERRKIPGSSLRADHDTFYFGAAFNGHLGRFTFNPAVYFVGGNADQVVAGAPVEHSVRAWMGLLDWQYKLDYWNFRAGYLYASGDSDPTDTRDTGWDSISDGTALFGGPLSYWVGENIRFGRGDFVRGNSLFPSLRGANAPANHINPGIHAFNGGVDVVLSPRFDFSANLNYLLFAARGAYTNRVVISDRSAGLEENVFLRVKPFLREINQNVIFDLGFSVLHPRQGLKAAFGTSDTVFSTFLALRLVY